MPPTAYHRGRGNWGMRELEMQNGRVVDADGQTPYCPECEHVAVPENETCQDCGAEVEWYDWGEVPDGA